MLDTIKHKYFRKYRGQFERNKNCEDKEYKALFLTLFGRLGPSSRYRAYQYVSLLKKKNIFCEVLPLIDDNIYEMLLGVKPVSKWQLRLLKLKLVVWIPFKRIKHIIKVRHYDVVYLQKDVLFPPMFTILRRLNSNIIFDLDDALYAPHPSVKYMKFNLGKLFLLVRRKLVNNILKKSRAITVTTKYLAEYAEKFNKDVHIITGPIDCDYYSPIPSKDRNEIVIGWMGSPTTTPFLVGILSALKQVIQTIPQCQIKAVGAAPFDTEGIPILMERWSLQTEKKQLADFDIGIMPLPNNKWSEGKGGLKILQYFAMQRPVVCSPVGINKELVIHGKNGFHAVDIDDWVKYLIRLVQDPVLRDSMGREGRSFVEKNFNLKDAANQFAGILRG